MHKGICKNIAYMIDYITKEELNAHYKNLLIISKEIDEYQLLISESEEILKRIESKQKPSIVQFDLFTSIKPEQVKTYTEEDKYILKNQIKDARYLISGLAEKLKSETKILETKLRFFYQNQGGVPMSYSSHVRNKEKYSRGEYLALKKNDFYPIRKSQTEEISQSIIKSFS